MFSDSWLYGTGAGSFRWLFPAYQDWDNESAAFGADRLWQYAHNDLLQFPAELGVVGMGIIFLMLGYFCWQLLARRTLRNPLAFFMLFTLGITMLHNAVDFNFQNPAILTTWGTLLALTTVLVRMERVTERRRRRRP